MALVRTYDSKDQVEAKDFGVGFGMSLRAYAICANCTKLAVFGAQQWTTVDVVLDGALVRFARDATGNYASVSGDGSRLVSSAPFATQPSRLTFYDRQGGTAIFDYGDKYICAGEAGSSPTIGNYSQQFCYYARYREAADGEFVWYTYERVRRALNVTLFNRLTAAYNSRGYGIRLTYVDPSTGDNFSADRYRVSKAETFRKICTPVAGVVSCISGTLASTNYFYLKRAGVSDGAGHTYDYYILDRVTDSLGGTTSFGYDAQLRLLWSKGPKNPTVNNFSNTYIGSYATSQVSQQTGPTNIATTYAYTAADTTIAIGSVGVVRKYGFSAANLQPDYIEDYGRRTSFAYDPFGRVTRITPPEGSASAGYSETTYDARGNATATLRKAKAGAGGVDIITSAVYPACSDATRRTCNKPTSTTDERGNVTNYSYSDAHGGVLAVLAPAADASSTRPLTRFGYDSFFPTIGTADPFPGTTPAIAPPSVSLLTRQERCQTSGAASSVVDFNAACGSPATTLYTYTPSSSGAPASVEFQSTTVQVASGDLTTAYSYDQIGNRLSVDGPNAGATDTTLYQFDVARRLTKTTYPTVDGIAAHTDYGYDAEGRTASISRSFGATPAISSTIYDTRGLATSTTGEDGVTTNFFNDDLGRRTDTYLTVDGQERRSRNVFVSGRLTEVRSVQSGGSVQKTILAYSYTSNGLKQSETDANGNMLAYCYDGFDLLAETRYPTNAAPPSLAPLCDATYPIGATLPGGITRESFVYDAAGNNTTQVRRDGRSLQYAYDARGQLIRETLPDANAVSYVYDLLGRRTSASSTVANSPAVGWSYDTAGRLLSSTTGSRSLGYAYAQSLPNSGSAVDLTWPDGFRVRYSSDALGRVNKIERTDGTAATLAAYNYDELSRRTQVTFGNGARTLYGYDAQFRLGCLAIDLAGGGSSSCVGGAPDSTGNDVAWRMTYNEASQIKTRRRDNDLYAWLNNNDGDTPYTPNGLNQYNAIAQTLPAHDAAGNLVQNGSATYAYDAENRLTSVVGPRSGTLDYDAVGRLARVASGTTTQFLYDGDDLVAESDDSGALVRRTVHGPGIDEPIVVYEGAGRTWLQADPQGSVSALSDDAGNLIAADSYGPWGEPGLLQQGRFGYTGQAYLSDLKLYHYKARAYSPRLGRFLQPDPIGTAGGINLYEYAGGDPINNSDPDGLDSGAAVYGPPAPYLPVLDELLVIGRRIPIYAVEAAPVAAPFNVPLFLLSSFLFGSPAGGRGDTCPCPLYAVGKPGAPPLTSRHPMVGASQSTPGDPNQDQRDKKAISTGRSDPRDLREKLALEEAKSQPELGTKLDLKIGDPRFQGSGWAKYAQNIRGVEIHYLRNTVTGEVLDFKIIGK